MNYAELIREAMNKMETLQNKAKTEKRDLSDDEKVVFDALLADIDKYQKAFENAKVREEKIAGIRAGLDTPVANNSVVNVVPGQKKWKCPGEFLNAVRLAGMPSRRIDNRLMLETGMPIDATGMSVSVGSDGGFMVGAENETWLMDSVRSTSQIFSRITPIPVGEDKNGTSIPAIAETSRVNGSRFGGVLAYWAAEAGSVAATKPTIRNVDIKLEKLLAFCYMTEELISDARAMEAFVRLAFGSEMSFKLDDGILNGNGNGQMLGILSSPALVTVDKENGQKADTIVYQNVLKMWSRIRARSKGTAVWLINSEIEPELSTMAVTVGTGGVPVYMPASGASGSPYSSLFGRPVIPCEQCAALGDKGDILLADLSDYLCIDKGGLAADSSIHVQFLYDELAFRFRYRVNGTPYSKSPLTPYKGSATTSPYVTLTART